MVCTACGQESPAGFKFCGNCGAPLGAEPERSVRKVVTVVFCDLTGSTALGDRTDPEALRSTMRGYYEEMRGILERHGGTVEKFVGDAVMAVFGVPVSHEDDALRAVRAAWEMRNAVATLGLQARIGVNTGEVVAGEGDTLVTGDAVNVAARLEQAAEPGEVLIGSDTQRLVRGAARVEPREVAAKGKPEPLHAFSLAALDLAADAIARRLDTPLVGREFELQQLRHAFDRVVRERRCHLFTLLGAAGVGKSRLTAELLASVDATLVHGRCLDYGEGITFWPVVSVLKQLGPRADATLELLVEGGASPNELFWSIRTLLEEVAVERPLVVVFDDIHWGEPTFLDLIDHVADLSRSAPIMLLCVARPDLLDRRPGWAGGKLNATTVLLEPLSREECDRLIESHGGDVAAETRTRIIAAADGNPLFVEEMLALARDGEDVRVPSTVHALLQARLDQLSREERAVIERGAVEGEVFHRGSVLELTEAPDVEPQLAGLVRKELILPERATFADDTAFRFRHLLIRDAAYDALPKETRASLHERFAAWLDARARDLIELDEIVGYHLEHAALYLRELGKPDLELERRAGARLAAAGTKAGLRSDGPGAQNLLRRALELLPDGDPGRVPAVLEYLEALELTSALAEQRRLIEELERHDDPRVRMYGQVASLQIRIQTDPHAVIDEAARVAAEAVAFFEDEGDDAGAARAHYLAFWVHWLQSHGRAALAELEEIIRHAERAERPGLTRGATTFLLGPLVHAPLTPAEIDSRLATLRKANTPIARYTVLTVEANLAFRAGRFEESLALHVQATAIAEELGMAMMLATSAQWPAEIELARGDGAAAVDTMRVSVSELEAIGQTSFRSTALIRLALALYDAGDHDGAERAAVEGEELGAAEDFVNFALGRSVRGQIAVARGDDEEGEALARDGLEYAYRTDFPWVRANCHEMLANVLGALGREDDARAEWLSAADLYERYGFTFFAERARASL